jgi:hypothetical protein
MNNKKLAGALIPAMLLTTPVLADSSIEDKLLDFLNEEKLVSEDTSLKSDKLEEVSFRKEFALGLPSDTCFDDATYDSATLSSIKIVSDEISDEGGESGEGGEGGTTTVYKIYRNDTTLHQQYSDLSSAESAYNI